MSSRSRSNQARERALRSSRTAAVGKAFIGEEA
jgi:hypothetical protein